MSADARFKVVNWFQSMVRRTNKPLAGTEQVLRPDQASLERESEFLKIHCDWPEPDLSDKPRSYSGVIKVRGWALAGCGIRGVAVTAQGAGSVNAYYGLPRPDVARHYPEIGDAANSGFETTFDLSRLPAGRQSLLLRAHSRGGATADTRVSLIIDHVNGAASEYHRWIADFEALDDAAIRANCSAFSVKPLVSILVPVFRTPSQNPRERDRLDRKSKLCELGAVPCRRRLPLACNRPHSGRLYRP